MLLGQSYFISVRALGLDQDHPADDYVEQDDGVDGQGFAAGGLTVGQERHGGCTGQGGLNGCAAWVGRGDMHIPNIDHARLIITTGTCTNHMYTCAMDNMRDVTAATTNGSAQYPSAHRLWKNDLRVCVRWCLCFTWMACLRVCLGVHMSEMS